MLDDCVVLVVLVAPVDLIDDECPGAHCDHVVSEASGIEVERTELATIEVLYCIGVMVVRYVVDVTIPLAVKYLVAVLVVTAPA